MFLVYFPKKQRIIALDMKQKVLMKNDFQG